MNWELEDQLTHESVAFRQKGEWVIGRELDPSDTIRFFAGARSLEANAQEQEKVLVPITKDYAKCRKLLSSFVLTKVSREHGRFGIDEQGPYFIDTSTNGTTLKDGPGYCVCEKEKKHYLNDGMILYLAASYPLSIRRRSRLRDLMTRVKSLFTRV